MTGFSAFIAGMIIGIAAWLLYRFALKVAARFKDIRRRRDEANREYHEQLINAFRPYVTGVWQRYCK